MYMDILNEEKVGFKELEQLIYGWACGIARELTVAILKALDDKLAKERDKSKYRNKGLRRTTIKTVYGEVEYSRRVYETKDEEGKKALVYLLDQEIGMEKIGFISTNLMEKIMSVVTNAPFRKTADQITDTTGQSISHSGVWNLVQKLGERLNIEEDLMVKEFQSDQSSGDKETKILFEEQDGIWIKSQKDGGNKAPGMEVKIGTMYEGWKAGTGKRSTLSGKTVLAGIMSGEEFREEWEAKIESIYDVTKIGRRILNSDGGDWIRDEYDADVIRQLDRFHIVKAIRQNTSDGKATKHMMDLLKGNKAEELVEYAQIYYDSISTNEGTPEEKNAKELLSYLINHKEEIANYKARWLEIPEAPEGLDYRNMGVQENQNCTVIGLRMKGKRKRWAKDSANNMIRLLYYRENHDLIDAIERYTDGELLIEPIESELKEPLSAAKAAQTICKGKNKYVEIFNACLPIICSSDTRTADMFRRLTY